MQPRRFRLLGSLLALLVIASACGGSSGDAQDAAPATTTTAAPTAASTSAAPPPTTAAPPETTTTAAPPEATTPPTTTAPDDAIEWVTHETGDGCMCADGSDYIYFTRTVPDATKVLLYFQGGGACFNEIMCSFTDGTYSVTAGPDDNPDGADGIFDLDNPENPFADYSMVFMPYCTGDVHLGDATTPYGSDLVVEHNGFPNAMHGVDWILANHSDATEVFVTGSSAGGVPAPLFAGIVADALPDAEVAALADASGGYPSNPAVNGVIGALWGTDAAVPDWPAAEGVSSAEFGIPDLFHLAGNHNPAIRFARYDNANDDVQVQFSAFANVGDAGLPAVLDQNEQLVEGKGVDLPVFIAPGTDHTILPWEAMYTVEVEGVRFVDWLSAFVAGDNPGDVRCTVCD